ncbi:MAG: prepilin-type N-terminal cleavage/methylation domain-containing protein, partial [Acinetobacter sp.]|uniref:pilus assembly FimT family protein n=1 Tax=Acinetobacter sp. TaxID=472 RepID=UPI002FCC3260
MRNNRGFTLVELMVTLAVLAIIAMMAVPFFGDMMLRQNLNKSQGELFAALNKAKSQALNKKRSVTVRLNVDLADTE